MELPFTLILLNIAEPSTFKLFFIIVEFNKLVLLTIKLLPTVILLKYVGAVVFNEPLIIKLFKLDKFDTFKL